MIDDGVCHGMNRRRLLLGTGGALSASVAGCIDDGASLSDSPGPSDDGPGDCETTDAGNDVEGSVRVDEPPQSIGSPDESAEGGEWNEPSEWDEPGEWNEEYLGTCMATEPSLSFEGLTWSGTVVAESGLRYSDQTPAEAYWAELVTSEDEREAVFGGGHEEARNRVQSRIAGVGFDESVLVVVQSGWGSGSIEHRWARVEAVDDGLHLHGYDTRPNAGTDDYTWRSSVLEVERPAEASVVRVSLTVDEDRRVHFDSTEGVVELEE